MIMNVDYNSIVEKGCIPLIIAIFAIGLPILLQTASRIDDKYSSTILLRRFYKEKITKLFIAINIFSLLSILIWFSNIPRIVDLGDWLNLIIDKSSFFLILINCILLVIFLFAFISLIKTYYDPSKLFNHLERKYEKE